MSVTNLVFTFTSMVGKYPRQPIQLKIARYDAELTTVNLKIIASFFINVSNVNMVIEGLGRFKTVRNDQSLSIYINKLFLLELSHNSIYIIFSLNDYFYHILF